MHPWTLGAGQSWRARDDGTSKRWRANLYRLLLYSYRYQEGQLASSEIFFLVTQPPKGSILYIGTESQNWPGDIHVVIEQ